MEKAKKEGLVLCIGDFNIDLEKLENSNYYMKKLAHEYQSMINEYQLEVLNFGITWTRIDKNNLIKESLIDHAITNNPDSVDKYYKIFIDYSDHQLICVDLKTEFLKLQNKCFTSRDYRKIRSNPRYFLNELAKVQWENFVSMVNVDEMQSFWTTEINKCLDFVAPWKERKVKQKRHSLPKEILVHIKKRKELQKRYQTIIKNDEVDFELLKELKKHNNFCNKIIKKAVREKNGHNITEKSSLNQVWNTVNDILKPERSARSSVKIETENKVIENPLELAETFNIFFKEKVEKLADKLRRNKNIDPLSKLREKLKDINFNKKFKLRTVNEGEVLKILKSLKPKKSFGVDGLSSEVIKLGAEVLVVPLTYIINYSITNGKFPTDWKISKVIPLHKKLDKKILKNYRPHPSAEH